MLVSAMFAPHPPLIIPEIGKNNISEAERTVLAMEKLGERLADADPQTVIIISPHGLIHQSEMLIGGSSKMVGSFESFDHPEVNLSFAGDPNLAEQIQNESNKNKIKTNLLDHQNDRYFLDHGALVPLYYLTKETGLGVKIVPISYSLLSRSEHFTFGQLIGQIVDKNNERIAVVGSGDMSHRLFESEIGKIGREFDQTMVSNIKNNNPGGIINIDEELQELAGECGYRSLLILLGVLDKKKIKPEVLSYEGPFGVGYLVADFKLL